jgi:hypothetical protein
LYAAAREEKSTCPPPSSSLARRFITSSECALANVIISGVRESRATSCTCILAPRPPLRSRTLLKRESESTSLARCEMVDDAGVNN